MDFSVPQLAVAQPADRIVLVEALRRPRRRFDVPLDDSHAEGIGHLTRQFRLAGPRFPFDQKRALEGDSGIHGHRQIIRGNRAVGSLEFHVLGLLSCRNVGGP